MSGKWIDCGQEQKQVEGASVKTLRSASAAIAAIFLAGAAHAVPIRFDFAGTVTSTTNDRVQLLNQSVSGFLTVETDGLVYSLSSLYPFPTVEYYDRPVAPGPSLFGANLTAGSELLPTAGVLNDGVVLFFDACQPDCRQGYIESFGVDIRSRGRPDADVPDGLYRDTRFVLWSQAVDWDTGQTANYYDITPEFDVTSILTLPLLDTGGFYNDITWNCVEGVCNSTSSFVQFDFTSITRSSASVPEPGTLGLLGAALAGMFFMRRRRPALTIR